MLIFHESKNAIHADVKDDGTMIPAVIQDLDANLGDTSTRASTANPLDDLGQLGLVSRLFNGGGGGGGHRWQGGVTIQQGARTQKNRKNTIAYPLCTKQGVAAIAMAATQHSTRNVPW